MTIEYQENITSVYYSNQFELVNDDLRRHFQLANREKEKVKEKVNELVTILHNDNPTWSIRKICNYIAGKNDDLADLGFSSRTIHRYLSDENRQLVDASKKQKTKERESKSLKEFREQKGKLVQNNVIEDDVDNACQHNILEDSSTTTGNHELTDELEPVQQDDLNEAIDSVYELDPIEAEPHIQYDNPQKIILQLKQRIIELVQPYKFEYTVIYKGQEIPLIVTTQIEIKSGMVEIDQKKSEK